MGGDPGDVLCPSVGLDIGPISGPDVEKARFDLLTAWLGGDFPLPDCDPDDYAQRDMLWEQRQRDRERLLEGENTARLCESGTATHLTPCVGFMMCFGNYGTVTAL